MVWIEIQYNLSYTNRLLDLDRTVIDVLGY